MRKESSNNAEIIVIKTDEGYLNDVWECWEDDEQNFDFTDNPFSAYEFYGEDDVPKYLGIYKNIKLNNIYDVCNYLNGKIIKLNYKRTVIVEWEEKECQSL